MEQKDYLMRYLDQLAIALARILGFKQEGRMHEALHAVDKALVGMKLPDLETLSGIPIESLLESLKTQKAHQNIELQVIGDLLYEAWNIELLDGNQDNANNWRQKALVLFEHLSNSEKIYSIEREDKIALLKKNP